MGGWARARGLAPPPLTGAIALDGIDQALQVAEAGTAARSAAGPWSTSGWRALR
jgi:LysR family transcriptional regulator, glycine cleavage system transcriptional activator